MDRLVAFFRGQPLPPAEFRGSIAFWVNRAAQHNPGNDHHGHRRLVHRITLLDRRPA